jgi:putative membrane protein
VSSIAIELPLFVVILGWRGHGSFWSASSGNGCVSIVTGLPPRTNHREAKKLEREVEALKGKKNEGRDEVLALVEDAGTAR